MKILTECEIGWAVTNTGSEPDDVQLLSSWFDGRIMQTGRWFRISPFRAQSVRLPRTWLSAGDWKIECRLVDSKGVAFSERNEILSVDPFGGIAGLVEMDMDTVRTRKEKQ